MTINTNKLIDIIRANKDKKLKATKIIEATNNNIVILPKLIKSSNITDVKPIDEITINRSIFDQLQKELSKNKQNNDYIIKMFPDIELSIQILVSSILSPKNMTDIVLNYKLDKELDIPSSISSELIELIKVDINKEYKLEDNLSDNLREALFETGASISVIIPESSVDELINSDIVSKYSNEELKTRVDYVLDSMNKNLNILDFKTIKTDTKLTALEELVSDKYVNITDNFNIFKYGKFKETLRKGIINKTIKNGIAISTEDIDVIKYTDVFRQKNNINRNKQIDVIKNKSETKRKSIGRPMFLKIGMEAVIPVASPNNVKEHIGYFILLDENGHPIVTTNGSSDNNPTNPNTGSTSTTTSLTEKAYKNLIGNNSNISIKEVYFSYKEIMEKKLYTSVQNSLYGSDVTIANRNDIFFMMFSRALAEQKTSIVFIPSELVSYMTFYYAPTGIGKSLLDNLSILSSLRAIMMFSKIMNQSKMAINLTKVNVGLDPEDPDPEKTIEMVQDSVLKMRQSYFPLGLNNPVDLIDWIQRAGLQFNYDSIPGMPNLKLDFENVELAHTVPSDDLEEQLRKLTIMSLGLSPEIIDNGYSPEFATTIVNNNILLSKRIAIYQKKLSVHLKKYIKIIVNNDEELRFKLRNFIEKNIDQLNLNEENKALYLSNKTDFYDNYIDNIVEHLNVELPKPENTNIVTLGGDYETYKTNLDVVLDSVLSSEVITSDLSGELSSHIDSIKTTYKHQLLRKWMSDNNYYPELFDIVRPLDTTNTNSVEIIKTELSTIMSNISNIFTGMEKFKDASDKDLTE